MKANNINDIYKFIIKTSECWAWTGHKHAKGYGVFNIKSKKLKAHRVSYELHIGAIPDGLHVLHKCDVPECTNPEHLYVGTNEQNVADKMNRKRHKAFSITHCPKGHEYPPAGGKRHCITCGRIYSRDYQRRKRAGLV